MPFFRAVLGSLLEALPGTLAGAWLLRAPAGVQGELSGGQTLPQGAAARLAAAMANAQGPVLGDAGCELGRLCQEAMAPVLDPEAQPHFLLLPAAGHGSPGTLDFLLAGIPVRGFGLLGAETWRLLQAALRVPGSERDWERRYLAMHEAVASQAATAGGETLFSRAVQALQDIFPEDFAQAFLVDGNQTRLQFIAATAQGEAAAAAGPDLRSHRIAEHVAGTGESVRVDDVRTDSRFPPYLAGRSIRSELVVPLKAGNELLGVLSLANPAPGRFTQTEERFLGGVASHLSHASANLRNQKRLQDAFLGTITTLANMIEGKDDYTGGHCQRLAEMALAIGIRLGFDEERLNTLTYAAILHDIGKVAIPDAILNKPGRLTPKEYRIMQEHPVIGRRLLEQIDLLRAAAPIVEQHHERVNGKGYPYGLKGKDILLEARIITVVDAFDAMTSTRPYRRALPKFEAVAQLREGAGSQFDPEVVNVFLNHVAGGGIMALALPGRSKDV
ncbi:MAG: HD domain-containing protein [Firmicutes bacterium]|nr:HD domain-containing protein [Bacillota bacterium]